MLKKTLFAATLAATFAASAASAFTLPTSFGAGVGPDTGAFVGSSQTVTFLPVCSVTESIGNIQGKTISDYYLLYDAQMFAEVGTLGYSKVNYDYKMDTAEIEGFVAGDTIKFAEIRTMSKNANGGNVNVQDNSADISVLAGQFDAKTAKARIVIDLVGVHAPSGFKSVGTLKNSLEVSCSN